MAFQAPNVGNQVELANRPGEYFLVDTVEKGRDKRGQDFWTALARDKDGQARTLHSDQVPGWRHWRGTPYQWHTDDINHKEFQRQQQAKQKKMFEFESKYRFPDDTPIRTKPGYKTLVRVIPEAQGALGAFADNNLLIESIDYENETITLSPAEPGYEDLASGLSAIPASEVAARVVPAVRGGGTVINLIDGTKVSAGDMASTTPALNALVRNGQIAIVARVEPNYRAKAPDGSEIDGQARFMAEMAEIGLDPEAVDEAVEVQISPRVGETYGAWSGDIRISPPVSEAALDEIRRIAIGIKHWPSTIGGFRVQSNDLLRYLVALGVTRPKNSLSPDARCQELPPGSKPNVSLHAA